MKVLKEILLVFLGFGVALSFFFWLIGGMSTTNIVQNSIVNGVGGVLMWTGNGLLAEWLNIHFPWVKNTPKRLFISIVTTIVYTFIAWLIVVYVWVILMKGQFGFDVLLRHLNATSFVITLLITFFISIFIHGSGFLQSWKQTLIEGEQLKKEQIAARYETLKNQVNPHFLFNSLNVLTTLVHKDADMAEQFIRQLSKVYRYVLDSRDKEVVPLTKELTQLEAYIYLMKIRFGESLKTTINIHSEGMVAPLTLQMLLENALKHNEASKMHPLSIDVFQEGNDYIVVKNNVKKKNSVGESTGVGLENIRSRYQFLSDKKILVHQDLDSFTVKIPIIQSKM